MPKIPLATLVKHCDQILRTRDIGDYDGVALKISMNYPGPACR
ncbi:MAG TPA: hypothetical protein VNN22_14520 [Verrucomicrobiae bacterium]|nr:hypothetical protein [Verrucomicrobiae bacterium]